MLNRLVIFVFLITLSLQAQFNPDDKAIKELANYRQDIIYRFEDLMAEAKDVSQALDLYLKAERLGLSDLPKRLALYKDVVKLLEQKKRDDLL